MTDPDEVEVRKSSRIATRLPRLSQPPPTLPPAPEPVPKKKTAKSASQRNKELRARILADPTRAETYRNANKERSRLFRANMTDEQRASSNEKAKHRNAEYRQRCTENEQATKTTTRSQQKKTEEQKQKETERKRKWRASLTPQRQTWMKKKRNEKRKQEKASAEAQALKNGGSTTCTTGETTQMPSPDKRTPQAQRKALSRARTAMPATPDQYAATLEDLYFHASPRKKLALDRRGLSMDNAKVGHFLLEVSTNLANKKDLSSRKTRQLILSIYEKYGTLSNRSRILKMNRKTVARHINPKENKRKKRQEETQSGVADFFKDVAAQIPDKKCVSKKTGQAQAQLRKPVAEYHKQYKQQGGKASYSKFAKCRPKHVRRMGNGRLNQCLCEYCENTNLKVKAVNRIASGHERIRHVYHAVALSTCRGGGKACAYRKCSDCDIHLLEEHLSPLKNNRGQLSWHRWTSKKVLTGGQEVNRKVLETRRGGVTELIQELCQEVAFLSEHLYRADWQNRQFQDLKNLTPFPSGLLIYVMDFAENYACLYQQEVQSAHWHHDSVTIHPIWAYRKCPHCDNAMSESLIFISNDMKHDHHAVHCFVKKTMEYMTQQDRFDWVIQWSDGCGAQYKSKGPFADIAWSEVEFGIPFEHCFFGSRHGKSPCDGEAAVVKSHVHNAVTSSDGTLVVSSAREFYDYCRSSTLNIQPVETRCCHFRRRFFWIPTEDIERDRPHRAIKTVKGTRDFHHIKSSSTGGVLLARHLTCLCVGCMTGTGPCQDQESVGPWREYTLVPDESRAPAQHVPDIVNGPDLLPAAPPDTGTQRRCQTAAADPDPGEPGDPSQQAPDINTENPPVDDVNTSAERRLAVGDFVKANILPASGNLAQAKAYHGMIEKVEEDGAVVRFLRQRGNYFVWPGNDDMSFVSLLEILEKLPVPTIDQRERYRFQ